VILDRHPEGVLLVHGGCPRGADPIAAAYAARTPGYQVEAHPADWHQHGRAAGYRRNAEMIAAGADGCAAFIRGGSPGSTMIDSDGWPPLVAAVRGPSPSREDGRCVVTRTKTPSCQPSYATADDVPAACPIGRSTAGTHGHSRTAWLGEQDEVRRIPRLLLLGVRRLCLHPVRRDGHGSQPDTAAGRSAWLGDLENELRVQAIVSDFGIPLDEWCDGHEEQFLALVTEAGRRLAERGTVTAQQAAAWIVLDGTPIIWRGQDAVDTDPIVTFAEALAAIIGGTYPQALPGQWWCFGLPGGVQTIQMRPSTPA
jgi:hypothetical protein